MAATRTQAQTDYRLGLEDLDAEVTLDAVPLEGELPAWLTGTLVRTAPAQWETSHHSFPHWFDGLAMLHKFAFAGGAVSYANRFLRTRAYRAAREGGELPFVDFATDPCRSLFGRVMALWKEDYTDNCNVNVARLGREWIAMTEGPVPVAFDSDTLETAGVAYRPPGDHVTAHPHHDPERRELLAYATRFGPRSSYRIYAQRDRDTQRVIAKRPVRHPAYMHSFAMTERYVVLTEQPLVVDPFEFLLRGRPFIDNFRWKPEQGTRFLVWDRHSGDFTGSFETDAFFCFHHANAFERSGELVVDLVAFPDPAIIHQFDMAGLRDGDAQLSRPELRRFRIDLGSGKVVGEGALVPDALELPRIDYARRNGRPYRYVYGTTVAGAGAGSPRTTWPDALIKADTERGESTVWHSDGCWPGEPVFVADPGSEEEDAGVLLSVVLDSERGHSFLLVLDAGSLEERARAEVPHHIPFGFHGMYSRAG
jgi:beta,beta-carotene 9',10'-dioxygenase